MKETGRVVTRPADLGDNVVVRRTIGDDEIYTDKMKEWHANVSATSGGVTEMTMSYAHNLGSARIYGATMLSHASAGGVDVRIGLVNASQIGLSFSQFHSGHVAVRGLGAHAWVMV